jgi:hypothetical protein
MAAGPDALNFLERGDVMAGSAGFVCAIVA